MANVIHAYSQSVRWGYICAIPVAGIATVCALFIKNRPLGPPKKPKNVEDSEKADTSVDVDALSRKSNESRAIARKDSDGSVDDMGVVAQSSSKV